MKKYLIAICLLAVGLHAQELPAPLTLDEAIAYGLKNSPSLKQVKENLLSQKGVLAESVGAVLPSVTASASASRVDDNFLETSSARAAGQNDWDASVMVSYSLFSGGKNSSNIRASYDEMKAAKEELRAQLDETLLSIKEAFYSVILAREKIEVQQEALDVLQTQLKNVTAQRDSGTSSDFEVLQAQVSVANEKPELIRAKNDYRVAVDQLAEVIGYVGSKELLGEDISGDLKITETSADLNKLLDIAYTNRPDLRQAQREVSAAQNKVRATGASYLPSVDLTGGFAWAKSDLTTSLDDDTLKGWQLGLSTSWTLFDGFSREAKMVQARAAQRSAQAAYTQERLNTEVTIREAYSSLVEARDILDGAEKTVEQARESLRLGKARFAAGNSAQLDVLQAQSDLSDSRLNLLNSRYDYIVACATLDRATGSKDWNISIEGDSASVQSEEVGK